MLELGHAQVGHGDEVLDVAEASGALWADVQRHRGDGAPAWGRAVACAGGLAFKNIGAVKRQEFSLFGVEGTSILLR